MNAPSRVLNWKIAVLGGAGLIGAYWLLSVLTNTMTIAVNVPQYGAKWLIYTLLVAAGQAGVPFLLMLAIGGGFNWLRGRRDHGGAILLSLVAGAVWVGLATFGDWYGAQANSPRVGEPCGPAHHWRYVGEDPAVLPDLSCEDDAQ